MSTFRIANRPELTRHGVIVKPSRLEGVVTGFCSRHWEELVAAGSLMVPFTADNGAVWSVKVSILDRDSRRHDLRIVDVVSAEHENSQSRPIASDARDLTVRNMCDLSKRGLTIDPARLVSRIFMFCTHHSGSVVENRAVEIPVAADDGSLWFAFGIVSASLDGHQEIEVVDVIPAQRTQLGLNWFHLIKECFDIQAAKWRRSTAGIYQQRQLDVVQSDLERLLEAVERFIDGLHAGTANIIDLAGLTHLLHDGRLALNCAYHSADADDGRGFHLEVAAWHLHEFVQQVGERLGLMKASAMSSS